MTADSAPPHLDAWWPRVLNGIRAAALAVRVTAPQRRGIAARTMLCIGLPLAIGLVTGHVEEGAAAAFGGLAGFSVPESPYRYRGAPPDNRSRPADQELTRPRPSPTGT
jgi:hypothetical protein